MKKLSAVKNPLQRILKFVGKAGSYPNGGSLRYCNINMAPLTAKIRLGREALLKDKA